MTQDDESRARIREGLRALRRNDPNEFHRQMNEARINMIEGLVRQRAFQLGYLFEPGLTFNEDEDDGGIEEALLQFVDEQDAEQRLKEFREEMISSGLLEKIDRFIEKKRKEWN